jgi:hypothetical protein
MRWFQLWSENQAHWTRWGLLLGWLALIAVLLKPELAPAYRSLACQGQSFCRPGIGNDLFWNVGFPLVVLAVLLSHELWRRICPLSFVSQLFRALGWQRTVMSTAGTPQLVAISESSWLARHHIQLQWSLLIAGLSLRIVIADSNGPVLAALFIAALLSALVSGWAYSGKAFCQYLCPFAPAQQILSGPRSLLSSVAHFGSPSKMTQSMCRTVGASGQEISTCVACAKPCLDIDSERTYWNNLSGQRGACLGLVLLSGPDLGLFSAHLQLRATRSRRPDSRLSAQPTVHLRRPLGGHGLAAVLCRGLAPDPQAPRCASPAVRGGRWFGTVVSSH